MKKFKLYWIYDNRIPHQCPTKDGYIGITSQTIEQRLLMHKTQQFNTGNGVNAGKIERKMFKILNEIPEEHIVIKEIVWSYDQDAMNIVEKAFRPEPNIGWNTQRGGKTHYHGYRPFIITKPDGRQEHYRTFAEANIAGYNDGNLHQHLMGNRKSFDFGHTARWA